MGSLQSKKDLSGYVRHSQERRLGARSAANYNATSDHDDVITTFKLRLNQLMQQHVAAVATSDLRIINTIAQKIEALKREMRAATITENKIRYKSYT